MLMNDNEHLYKMNMDINEEPEIILSSNGTKVIVYGSLRGKVIIEDTNVKSTDWENMRVVVGDDDLITLKQNGGYA